ncbi:MAG: hypothetical protein V1707_03765, partial [bacterium]
DAIKYYRAGDWQNLERYCLDDVRITRDVYWYGQRHGQIWFKDGGQLKAIPVPWRIIDEEGRVLPLVKDLVNEAWAGGKQLSVEYLGDEGRRKMEVDILAVDGNTVRAYDHGLQAEQKLLVTRIFDAKVIGQVKSFQQKLL